ncbi:hypothetical protein [Solidesulfovibrio alcoholivorans]|uniref:hypothetical protein n=1 Tax=Solidesulfovibrio alcoholivorans TaxID=81406 RepID=UPI0012EB9DB0|nr:hypothetical protein [Solidesulfovibrio alcoholivorans]
MRTRNPYFDKESLDSWNRMLSEMFPVGVPLYCEWVEPNDIVSVLDCIGKFKIANHSFFPNGGGLDLEGCRFSGLETDCIEIDFSSVPHIVKPRCLSFDSIGTEQQLSYFRLELENLEPTGVYGQHSNDYEELAVVNGKYVDRSFYDAGEHGGKPLPKGSRVVRREWGGAILVFCKVSPYNKIPMTYDDGYARMNKQDFHKLIVSINSELAKKASS